MKIRSEAASSFLDQKLAVENKSNDIIGRLWTSLHSHLETHEPVPERTARLAAAGIQKMAKKLVEESGEVALAAAIADRKETIHESADLLYHLTMLWASLGIRPEEVWSEMQAREDAYGLAEKRAKGTP